MWSPAEFLWSRSGIPTPTSITGWSGRGTRRNRLSPTHGLRCIPYKDVENSFKEWRTNNTAWQLYYILKANGYSLLSLWRFSLGTVLDGIYPTSMMDIPVGQQSVIYNGEIYNQELTEVAELITSPEAIKNNLAVAFLTKIIYQWICLMYADGKRSTTAANWKLIATLHASLQQRWSVADMAATIPCSEARLRRLFYAIPARRRKNITSMRVWIWRYRY